MTSSTTYDFCIVPTMYSTCSLSTANKWHCCNCMYLTLHLLTDINYTHKYICSAAYSPSVDELFTHWLTDTANPSHNTLPVLSNRLMNTSTHARANENNLHHIQSTSPKPPTAAATCHRLRYCLAWCLPLSLLYDITCLTCVTCVDVIFLTKHIIQNFKWGH